MNGTESRAKLRRRVERLELTLRAYRRRLGAIILATDLSPAEQVTAARVVLASLKSERRPHKGAK